MEQKNFQVHKDRIVKIKNLVKILLSAIQKESHFNFYSQV